MSREFPVIVIDPGHGGTAAVGGSSSNNATGPNGLLEKDLTLDIAQRVARSLAGSSSRVILTRTDDTNLSLAARAEVARANNARLFLSIHLNGFRDASVDGTEVWVARAASQASEGFAQRVLSRLLAVTRVSNRGIRRADFGVLLPGRHAPETLACLAEIAFLTNAAQARRLEGEEYRRALAGALEEAIRQYLPSQHFLHHSVRPENRIPPPVPFGLSRGAGVDVAGAPPESHAHAQQPGAHALDSQRRHGPQPYREAVRDTRLFCRQNVNRWEQRIADAETRLTSGLVSRFSPNALAELDEEQSCYSMLGLGADHAAHRRRLQSVLARIAAWVFDTSQSAIAQIEDATKRAGFLSTDWSKVSYPGNAGDTAPATRLFNEMTVLVPERRVPQLVPFETVDSVVVSVPGTSCNGCDPSRRAGACRLLPPASDSFVAMRTAAAAYLPPPPPAAAGQTPTTTPATGVGLRIGSAFRSAQEQQQIAAGNPNPVAVAQSRSAHTYGLAIDLCLSVPGLSVTEITTRPMTNIVAMYRSPVYKWMFLFGAHFGWFPYRAEPWHWEYNPPGFPERFRAVVRELTAARQPARGGGQAPAGNR